MNGIAFTSGIISSVVLLSGCGFSELSDRSNNPILLDRLSDADVLGKRFRYETISTDASRRTIFVRYWEGETRADFVCAEPPPDALQAYASAVAAAAKAGDNNIETGLDFSSSQETSASPLLYRSQGLQLYRDQAFNLCIMRMNGIINNEEYLDLLRSYATMARDVITVEQKALEIAAGQRPVVVGVKATSVRNNSSEQTNLNTEKN